MNESQFLLPPQVEEPSLLSDSEDAVDSRQWTQHHLAAADIRVPPTMALTPPQGEFESDCMDVNVRGPGRYRAFPPSLGSLPLPRSVRVKLIPFPFQTVSRH